MKRKVRTRTLSARLSKHKRALKTRKKKKKTRTRKKRTILDPDQGDLPAPFLPNRANKRHTKFGNFRALF